MEGEIVFRLILMLVFGAICAAIANSKGRSPVGFFFIGFFFPCIGLIIILCLSNENEKKAQWEAQNVQNRRLQEQLRQEQMKSESLRQHTLARLDQHDNVLGIDTKDAAPQLAMQQQPKDPFAYAPKLESPLDETDSANDSDIWYYEYSGTQRGPTSINELKKLKNISAFTEESLVWKEGMENWEQAKLQPELAKVLYS